MGFLQAIVEFLESIFKSNSPEVRKRAELKKIEADFKTFQPIIYKNNLFTPNFAEIFRVLYENTKPIGDLLFDTVSSEDVQRKLHFEMQLLLTGFSSSTQEKLESLSYENRKQEVLDSKLTIAEVCRDQRHLLESIIKELNTESFLRIDEVIAALEQLTDICRYNYIGVIHTFDPDYTGGGYTPNFQPAVPDSLAGSLQDLYYLTGHLNFTSSVNRALLALAELRAGRPLHAAESQSITGNIRKINTVFTRILNPEILKKLICLARKDPAANPQIASYKVSARQKFVDYMQDKFNADEKKLKVEIKDITISAEMAQLFGTTPLEGVNGYNAETNETLQQNTPSSFTWITAVQIVKTFLKMYLSQPVMALLNDIVIEGFFSNSSVKTEFSSVVYAAGEIPTEIEAFEKSFERNQPNDTAVLLGFIRDSHKDAEFLKRLASSVDTINKQANNLVQVATRKIYSLYMLMNETFVDAKKSSPDTITNIKVLLNSSRNRDASELLEHQFDLWKVFLEIMKNYVVVGDVEKKA